jgi:hypothetical protein
LLLTNGKMSLGNTIDEIAQGAPDFIVDQVELSKTARLSPLVHLAMMGAMGVLPPWLSGLTTMAVNMYADFEAEGLDPALVIGGKYSKLGQDSDNIDESGNRRRRSFDGASAADLLTGYATDRFLGKGKLWEEVKEAGWMGLGTYAATTALMHLDKIPYIGDLAAQFGVNPMQPGTSLFELNGHEVLTYMAVVGAAAYTVGQIGKFKKTIGVYIAEERAKKNAKKARESRNQASGYTITVDKK